ncbi:hypothetical protein QYF36_026373 [Acer negundo]|nr:hypothetical protein QYF36_026373 [Acer negundo]
MSDWPKWKEAIQTELTSLAKREVFGSIIQMPENIKPVGCKWVFIRKRNEKNDVVRYKARLVAQDLGKTKYCLGLEIKHRSNEILVHQSAYTENIFKRLHIDNAHPLSTPMVVRTLDPKKDPFRPKENGEKILGPEVPYLNVIGALLYLAQCTRSDIAFSVNVLARLSSAPTRRHWNGIKHLFRYLSGTKDLGLFYTKSNNFSGLLGYADARYLSDPHKARSQMGYVFTYNGTTIS